MDPTLLTTLISLGVSIVTVLAHKYLTTTPAAGTAAASVPASAAASTTDAFAGLPGLPGHPLLNALIGPFLNAQLTAAPAAPMPPASAAVQQAAIAALAQIVLNVPGAAAQMQTALQAGSTSSK
jgi:hypothetical protein